MTTTEEATTSTKASKVVSVFGAQGTIGLWTLRWTKVSTSTVKTERLKLVATRYGGSVLTAAGNQKTGILPKQGTLKNQDTRDRLDCLLGREWHIDICITEYQTCEIQQQNSDGKDHRG